MRSIAVVVISLATIGLNSSRTAFAQQQRDLDDIRAEDRINAPDVQAKRVVSPAQLAAEIRVYGHVLTQRDLELIRSAGDDEDRCRGFRTRGTYGYFSTGCSREELIKLKDARAAERIRRLGIVEDTSFRFVPPAPHAACASNGRMPHNVLSYCAALNDCGGDDHCVKLVFQKERDEKAAQDAGCRRDTPLANVTARQTPEAQRILRSTELCWQQTIKRTAEADIAKERKYAKKYGARDIDEINTQKLWIESADENIAKLKAALKDLGGPLACTSPSVTELMTCEVSDPTDTSAVHEFNACQCAGRGLPSASITSAGR